MKKTLLIKFPRMPYNNVFKISEVVTNIRIWDIMLYLQNNDNGRKVNISKVVELYQQKYKNHLIYTRITSNAAWIGYIFEFVHFGTATTSHHGKCRNESYVRINNVKKYFLFREKYLKNKKVIQFMEENKMYLKIDPKLIKERKRVSMMDDAVGVDSNA